MTHKRPSPEIELGDLKKPGAVIWSYTAITYDVTMGWKPRKFKRRGVCIAVMNLQNHVRWLPLEIIKKQQYFIRTAPGTKTCNETTGRWAERWQITPKPIRGVFI
jgi:hypothetical protein